MAVRKKKHVSIFSVLVLLLLTAVALALALLRPKGDPAEALDQQLRALAQEAYMERLGIDGEITDAAARCFMAEYGPFRQRLLRADGEVTVTVLDPSLLTDGLADDMQALLGERAAGAKRSAELYAADGTILPDVCEQLYGDALRARLSHAADYCGKVSLPIILRYRGGEWLPEDPAALKAMIGPALPSRPGFEESVAALEPVRLHYIIARNSPSPMPDPACYGETEDPQKIAALLRTETAKRLIDGQKLDFDPSRDMLGRRFSSPTQASCAASWRTTPSAPCNTTTPVSLPPRPTRSWRAAETFTTTAARTTASMCTTESSCAQAFTTGRAACSMTRATCSFSMRTALRARRRPSGSSPT